jgi:hypothetical protein
MSAPARSVTLPAQPPVARLTMRLIGLFMSAGVAVLNTSTPSTNQVIVEGVQSAP